MLEILSPAGSPEGVVAAVQNGADAVYLGFGEFNARQNAQNFSDKELYDAIGYCRVRGVYVYITINTLISDRELPSLVEKAKFAARSGADALIIQDLGVMRALRQALPDIPLHASTQMGIHNLEGVKIAAAMGLSRVILARELSRRDLEFICANSPIDVEVFVHGALCMCYSGQCYMSGVIGRRSGNRGMCAQPCRLNYSSGGHAAEYVLSLKDNCLIHHLRELEDMGVKCIKIEGRMKRPEYSAIVTGIYSKVVKDGKPVTSGDVETLKSAFSRQGFTDGFYTDTTGADMLGIRTENQSGHSVIFQTARKNYLNGEYQRVPVHFMGQIRDGEPVKLAAADDRRNTSVIYGPVPELAFHKEITFTALQTQLHKTGGTPFYCAGVKGSVEPGLSLPLSAFNELRRTLLTEILEKRKEYTPPREDEFVPGYHLLNREEAPVLAVSITSLSQLSDEMERLCPEILYVPAKEFDADNPMFQKFLKNPKINTVISLPRVIHDDERHKITDILKTAKSCGVTEALVGNLGQIQLARGNGFNVRGDFGLNIFNSQALKVYKDLGLMSATLSFELRLAEIRDISKSIDTEIITYGRLPLMITENCIIKNSMGVCACDSFTGLLDRQGALFPVISEFGCRSVLLNSKKLFLADKSKDTATIGLWAQRLMFTTENAHECASVISRYKGLGQYEPVGYTRGLYYRGVE